MATTTNYGFDIPTSADLVKNGATAIATLGQNIDTFLLRPFAVNPVINSAMQIAQRGTSIAVGTGVPYTLDRWQATRGGVAGMTVSRQDTNDTTNLPFIQYCLRAQRDSGNTSAAVIQLDQSWETVNSIPFAGRTVTWSFYARAGANMTNSNNLLCALLTGTGTDQNYLSAGYTGQAVPVYTTINLTTTWTRYTFTATLASTAKEITIQTSYTPSGTAGAADFYEITGVQVEVGSVATPFRTNGRTIQQELAACQRYYWRVTGQSSYGILGTALGATSTVAYGFVNPNTQMRAMNSITSSGVALIDGPGALTAVTLAIQSTYVSTNLFGIVATAASGLNANRPYHIHANNSTTSFIAIDGEL